MKIEWPHSTRRTSRRVALQMMGWTAAGVLSGCRGGKKKHEVVFWHEDATEEQVRAVRAQIDVFEKQHPDITVRPNAIRQKYLRTKLRTSAQNGSLPDVFVLNSYWAREPLLRETLEPLSPRWIGPDEEKTLAAEILPHDLARCRVGGSLVMLPAASAYGGLVFLQNPGLLERLGMNPEFRPANWAEFTAFSRELVAKANRGREIEVAALDPFYVPGILLPIVLAHGAGGTAVSPDGRTARYLEPEMRRSLAAIDSFVQEVYAPFGGYVGLLRWRNNVGANLVNIRRQFIDGRLAFCPTGTGVLSEFAQANRLGNFRAGFVPGLERRHGAVAAHALSYGMSRRAQSPEAAWKLLRYLTVDPAGNGEVSAKLLRPCPIKAVHQRPEYAALGQLWTDACAVMAADLSFDVSSFSEFLSPMMEAMPYRRVQGDSLETILADMNRVVQGVLDEINRDAG